MLLSGGVREYELFSIHTKKKKIAHHAFHNIIGIVMRLVMLS